MPDMVLQTVLSVHNFYRQPGGEDRVFADEASLLEQHGHTVVRYQEQNRRIAGVGISASGSALWSNRSFRRLRSALRAQACGVVHFHNTFPLISPAGYYAAAAANVPVVQTLHNYRLICPAGTLLRDGAVCEKCIGRVPLPALIHGCYRGSRPATAAVAAMLAIHRVGGTWRRMVDAYIAPSEFARKKLIAGGLPPERIVMKPNFVAPDPGAGTGRAGREPGGYALFAGRLAEEKGVRTLLQAWERLGNAIPLVVAGEGPLGAREGPVTFIGQQPREKIFALMRNASILIFPSICYECAPLTVIEAFACGLPVIASNIGSIPEFVDHGRTGLLFRPGDAEDLGRQVRWTMEHPDRLALMRQAARREFETKYTAERNYKMLTGVYELAFYNWRRRADYSTLNERVPGNASFEDLY
jgi:glycosyltransferase involved in cell wall biosynthesis